MSNQLKTHYLKEIFKYIIPILGVAITVLVFSRVWTNVPDTSIVLVFILVVLLCATFFGFGSSLTAAIAGALAFNFFFIEPVGTFRIEHSQDVVAFIAFLMSAIIVSTLSSMVRKRAQEIEKRKDEVEKLYRFSKLLIEIPDNASGAVNIADSIVNIFGFEYCGIHVSDQDGTWKHISISSGYPDNVKLPDPVKFRVSTLHTLAEEDEKQVRYETLKTPAGVVGLLALRAGECSEDTLKAISSFITLTLQRNGLFLDNKRKSE